MTWLLWDDSSLQSDSRSDSRVTFVNMKVSIATRILSTNRTSLAHYACLEGLLTSALETLPEVSYSSCKGACIVSHRNLDDLVTPHALRLFVLYAVTTRASVFCGCLAQDCRVSRFQIIVGPWSYVHLRGMCSKPVWHRPVRCVIYSGPTRSHLAEMLAIQSTSGLGSL